MIDDDNEYRRQRFYDINVTMNVKVFAVLNESNVVVKDYDVTSQCATGSDIIFNKVLGENLTNEEHS